MVTTGISLAASPRGAPIVAWQDNSPGDMEIHVRQATNLAPLGLEVTQAIQSITNTVTLVEGQPTYARYHVVSAGPALEWVGGHLFAFRDGRSLGEAIEPLNLGGVIIATAVPDSGKVDESLLFQLDPCCIPGTLQLGAEINPAQTVGEADRYRPHRPRHPHEAASLPAPDPEGSSLAAVG